MSAVVLIAAIVADAARLLALPGAWCQGAHALDAAGHSLWAGSKGAVSWSLEGAIAEAAEQRRSPLSRGDREAIDEAERVAVATIETLVGGPLPAWNDLPTTTHGDVVDLLERCSTAWREAA